MWVHDLARDRPSTERLGRLRLAPLKRSTSGGPSQIEVKFVAFAAERAMAEQGLSNYERDETAEPVFPPAAQRIRRAREALGLTQDDVASRWGDQTSMYWDLELFDAEAFTVISVRQLQRLASVLGASVNALLFGEEPAGSESGVTYADVVARLHARMTDDAVGVEELGNSVGWDLQALFADPGTLGDMPVDGLRSVCRAATVDWVTVLSTRQPA
jgi:transcriptional regulator with XRE-family HTH domain